MSSFSFKEGLDVFSPKDLVQLGRPGAGTSNPAGDLALVSFGQYSFADKKNSKSIYIVPLESPVRALHKPLDNGGETFWLNDREIALVVTSEDKKHLDLYIITVEFRAEQSLVETNTPKFIGKFPTSSATNFRYEYKNQILVFSDQVYEDGDIKKVNANDEEYENRGNTAYVYDSRWVDYDRHWDHWVLPKKNSLFSVRLWSDPDFVWHLDDEYTNLLRGTGHHSPVEPFGGTDDFDVAGTHVVYTTKDPNIHFAWHTKQDVFVVDTEGRNRKELTGGKQGATHSPVFSPFHDKVAWLELDRDGYESDRAKIIIYDLKKDVRFTVTQHWDRSPDGLAFSKDGKILYFTAGDEAKVKVFAIAVPETPSSSSTDPKFSKSIKPVALTHNGTASGLQTLFNHRILFSVSSLTSPNDLFIIRNLHSFESELLSSNDGDAEFKEKAHQITKLTEEALKPKKLSVGEEFWFDGVDQKVQAWVLKPRGWEEGKKKAYPVVMLIHGGPQGAWEDGWSTRWNPNVFAGQGYYVIAFNPTGSTTFGQKFTDAIAGDWGGKPFQDLIRGWDAAKKQYSDIDFDKAVAAGASWGGYAINWIQGHPEYGFNFKALVCHDGVFDSNYNGFSTDELFFFNHDWKGRPWDSEAKKLSEKFSPSNHVTKWSTPQLLIHGSKDYRLPETESLGAFHALQQQGIPSRLVVFPDENHWVLNHGNSLKWHYEVFKWFDEFLNKEE